MGRHGRAAGGTTGVQRTWPADARRRDGTAAPGPAKRSGPARARAADERGAAMTAAAAAEYALLLADPGPPQPDRARPGSGSAPGNGSWSPWLPGAGSDAQIAAELYISIRTVRSHLDRIGDKTGCRRRVDLTRLALSAGLV